MARAFSLLISFTMATIPGIVLLLFWTSSKIMGAEYSLISFFGFSFAKESNYKQTYIEGSSSSFRAYGI